MHGVVVLWRWGLSAYLRLGVSAKNGMLFTNSPFFNTECFYTHGEEVPCGELEASWREDTTGTTVICVRTSSCCLGRFSLLVVSSYINYT